MIEGKPIVAETFKSKLKQMRLDLGSIVDRMNKDRSIDKAMLAQTALNAVYELEDCDPWLEELPWDWKPSEEPDEC